MRAAAMAKKKDEGSRTMAVKLDARLAKKARSVADERGISVSAYLAEITGPRITKDWERLMRAIDEKGGEA
jgi:hypothetical protein